MNRRLDGGSNETVACQAMRLPAEAPPRSSPRVGRRAMNAVPHPGWGRIPSALENNSIEQPRSSVCQLGNSVPADRTLS